MKCVKSRTVGHLERVKSRTVGHLEHEKVGQTDTFKLQPVKSRTVGRYLLGTCKKKDSRTLGTCKK